MSETESQLNIVSVENDDTLEVSLPSDLSSPLADVESNLSEYLVLNINREVDETNTVKQTDEGVNETNTQKYAEDEALNESEGEQKTTSPTKSNERKRKREEDEDTTDILTGVFLRVVYPLSKNMDKTLTVGLFKSLNFKPAVLLNHCGKSSILFTSELWDSIIQYSVIIETYLYNHLTGKKTNLGFDASDIEIDNMRVKGNQFVRFRDMAKHNKKILLSIKEFHVLSMLAPSITRYISQLVTYEPVISHYLSETVQTQPTCKLNYGHIDPSFYNRLPHEVDAFRSIDQMLNRLKNTKEEDAVKTQDDGEVSV